VASRLDATVTGLWLVRLGRRSASPRNLWRVFLAAGLLVIAGLYVFGNDDLRTWASPALAGYGAAGMVFGARRSRAAQAGSWYGLALGIALLGLGDLVWGLESVGGVAPPVPSLADVIYLAGYAAALVATASLAWPRGGGRDVDALIDTAIASLGVGLVACVFLLVPSAQQAAGLDAVGTVVTLCYPLLDVALVVVLVGMLMGPQRSPAIHLLLVSLAAFLISDTLYLRQMIDGTYVSGSPTDLGWMTGFVLWGAVGLHPSARTVGEYLGPPERRSIPISRAVGLLAALLIAPSMLLWAWSTGRLEDVPLIAFAGIVLTMLWASRLWLTVRRLRRALDERQALEWQLREQAERDSLLGLLNRASFIARLRSTLAANQAVAVLYVDLDNFKVINDTLGHPGGDDALVEIARRIESLLRPPDIVARLGGDEFGVMLPAADVQSAEAVAVRLLQRIERPLRIDGREFFIHASAGISCGGPEKATEDLIREADVAMYLAKGKGKSRHVVFEAEMHADVMRRIELRSDLEEALMQRQLAVLYQPVVTMPGGVVRDCEALIRWQHPVRGLLLPEDFIDLAEETGIIINLGRWLLDEACHEAVRWQEQLGKAAPGVAVNISALQVSRAGFAAEIAAALDRSGLDPRRLAIEITESTLIEVESAASVVAELAKAGVRIAIDDFGTGYSALSYLATYPVDILKIDRSFVSAVDAGPREARLASAIIALGKDLELQVIAEGVETENQLAVLAKHGCTSFQGYLFARPMAGRDLVPLLEAAARRHEPFTKDLRPLRRSA
jgi:diguanylate cyclase (GGDEF)-like protein